MHAVSVTFAAGAPTGGRVTTPAAIVPWARSDTTFGFDDVQLTGNALVVSGSETLPRTSSVFGIAIAANASTAGPPSERTPIAGRQAATRASPATKTAPLIARRTTALS